MYVFRKSCADLLEMKKNRPVRVVSCREMESAGTSRAAGSLKHLKDEDNYYKIHRCVRIIR